MRIALFTDTYLPTVNGVARALGLLVEHARPAGHEVALVTPRVSGEPAPGVVLHEQVPGVPAPFYPELQAARPWIGGESARRLEAFGPDVVHAATEAAVGLAGRRWALRRGVPLVTSFNTHFPDYLAGYGMGWFERPLWRYLRWFHAAAGVRLCPSDWARGELLDHGFPRPVHLWSRGVDADVFNPRHRSEALRAELAPGADVILLYVGRIAPEKRVSLLLDAWSALRERSTRRLGLVLVGDGPALETLRARREPGVRFTGYRRGQALAACYASADVFVFASDAETFGQVVTEAQASGLPVVAPARGGVVDTVVPGRTGALFPPGDPQGLAEATLPLVEDDRLRHSMARQARVSAEARTWGAVFERLFMTYRNVPRAAMRP